MTASVSVSPKAANPEPLGAIAERVGALLRERGQTVAVDES